MYCILAGANMHMPKEISCSKPQEQLGFDYNNLTEIAALYKSSKSSCFSVDLCTSLLLLVVQSYILHEFPFV